MSGELEKRCFGRLKTICVHTPYEDEKGEIQQYFHDSSRLPTREEIKQVFEEMWSEFPCTQCEICKGDCFDYEQRCNLPMKWKNKWGRKT